MNDKIDIVCTCGGIYPDDPWRVGFVVEVNQRSPVPPPKCRILRDADGQRTGVELRCTRDRRVCRRAPQLTWANWRQLVAGYDAAGFTTLDISML